MTRARCNNEPLCPWVNTAHGMRAHDVPVRCPRCLRKATVIAPTNVAPGRGAGARRSLCSTCTVALLQVPGGAGQVQAWETSSIAEVADAQRQGDPGHAPAGQTA